MQPIIVAEKLTKTYIATPALDTITFSVSAGEAVAIIGANGAGKSTLINILLGLTAPDSPPDGGRVSLFGSNGGTLSADIKQRIGYISDNSCPIPWATISNIESFYNSIYNQWDRKFFMTCLARWNIDLSKRLITLSKGQRRMVEIALVVSYHPDCIFLDEPFNGLDPVNRYQIQCLINDTRQVSTLTLVYATHVLSEIPKLAERVIMLKEGKIVLDSSVDTIENGIENTFNTLYNLQ
jgi:ABC-2 type transport system ATP-binding protein